MEIAEKTGTKATLRCQFCQSWNRIDVSRAADRPKCGNCGKPMLLDRPIHLDDETFARTIAESEVPVMVDFYADWCGPCRMLAPVVDEVAGARAGRALVVKLDTDRSPEISERYGIRGIPTLIAFRGGREIGRHVGLARRPQLDALLDAP